MPIIVLGRVLIALLIFWGLVWLLVPAGQPPAITLSVTYFCGLVAFLYVLLFLRRAAIINTPFVLFAATIFTVKVFLGIWHYVTFIDASYFDTETPAFHYIADYEWLVFSMTQIREFWSESGFGVPDWLFERKNTGLLMYFALLFYLPDNEHFLNVAVLNSLHNVLVAVLIAGHGLSITTKRVVTAAFCIALLQPFGLFSSIMWRDSVGQAFYVAGAIMIVQYRGGLRAMQGMFAGALLMALLRNIYFLTGLVSIFVSLITVNMRKNAAYYLGSIGGIILMGFAVSHLAGMVFEFYDFSEQKIVHSAGLSSIKQIATAIIGPFPWTQILDPTIPGREYLLADILQAAFSMSVWLLFFRGVLRKKLLWTKSPHAAMLTIVATTTLLGVLSYGHVPYVTLASVLLLPMIPGLRVSRFLLVWWAILAANFVVGGIWDTLS